MLLRPYRIDLRTNRNLRRQIKPIPGQRHQLADQFLLRQRHHRRVAAPPHPSVGRQYLLERHAVNVGKYGAQRFVAGDEIIEGRAQRLDVQRPADPEGDRHVVGRHPALEPIEEPQPALGERQRDHGGPLTCHQRLTPTRISAEARCQLGNRGRFEQRAHRKAGIQAGVDGGDHPHRR